MGGTIRIDSTPGKGTVFTVELPLRLPHEEEDEHFWEHHHMTRMLLVDDDKNICDGIKENMKDSGVEFDAVYSGENAVSLVKKEYAAGKEYSAIILDRQMPGMNGYEDRKDKSFKTPRSTYNSNCSDDRERFRKGCSGRTQRRNERSYRKADKHGNPEKYA